jgi:hypothetical protein
MLLCQRSISLALTLTNQFILNSLNLLRNIQYSLGGNSSNSSKIFTLEKKMTRIIAVTQPRTSCISLFKKVGILPVPCKYPFSLINLTVNNQEGFQKNSPIHNIKTRNKHLLQRPHDNLSCCQKTTL